MSLSRPFAVRLSLALASGAGVTLILGLAGVFSCSTYPTFKTQPIECADQQGFEFSDPVDDFTQENWYGSPDYTPAVPVDGDAGTNKYVASMPKPTLTTIPDGPVCGSSNAGVFRASHNNDWGGIFGMWGFGNRDGSSWHGISFWARAPGATTKAFMFLLDDSNTMKGGHCRSYELPDGGVAPTPTGGPSNGSTDPGTGTPIAGNSNSRAQYPDECGNSYYAVVTLTSDWQLYTLPWRVFDQNYTPNRVSANGVLRADPKDLAMGTTIRTAELRQIGLRPSKEAELELWMANLAFYRKKAP